MPERYRISTETLRGPAGNLEAVVFEPPSGLGVGVVAHPHPLHGGTMHTKVVHRAARMLASRFGLLSVRFNFRGVGASDGRYDHGNGETEDLLAVCQQARERRPEGLMVLAGFSFGSFCAMTAAPRVRPDVLLLIGIPLHRWDRKGTEELAGTRVAWIQGEVDEYGDGALALPTAERFGWDLTVVADADHFFTGKLDAFEEAAAAAVSRALDGEGRES